MAQHDYVIDNSTGANVRSDINSVLQAIASNNSGSSAPSTTYAFQLFANTTDSMLQLRNAANNAFVNLRKFDGTLPLPDGSASSPSLFFDDDTNTGIFSSAADTLNFTTGGVERMELGATTIFNEDGADVDFRVEGDTDANLFYLDAGNDRIGISTASPAAKLHVSDTYHFTAAGGNSTTGMMIGNYDGSSYGVLSLRGSTLRFDISNSEKMRIDSSGRILINTTAQSTGTNSANAILTVNSQTGNATSAAILALRRGQASASIAQNNTIGRIVFCDSQAGEYAFIEGEADLGSNGVGDTAGRIAFSTSADGSSAPTERMRIDSSGRVGIGTTTQDSADDGAGLKVDTYVQRNASYSSPDGYYGTSLGEVTNGKTKVWASVDSHYSQASAVSAGLFLKAFHQDAGGSGCGSTIKNLKTGNALVFSTVTTGASVGNPAVESERMRIDSSGRVGIGTTSPDQLFHVSTGSDTSVRFSGDRGNADNLHIANIEFENTFNNQGVIAEIRAITGNSGTQSSQGQLAFYTDDGSSLAERMRIGSDGSTMFNRTNTTISTSSFGASFIMMNAINGSVLFKTSRDASGSFSTAEFFGTGGQCNILGDGDVVNTNNSYSQISDETLKQDIVDAASQWNDIKAIKVRKFRFKDNPTGDLQIGVVAQEVEKVSPKLVKEIAKSSDDINSTETIKAVKYSILYMKAIKALQEAMTRIETLETKVEALEAA